ncbi:MAG: prolyl oligopeptidase family serine peptidase [Cyanobacteria bacterium P01_H01_bin.15]
MTKIQAAAGSWQSPITTDLITASTIGLKACALANEKIVWLEGRPQEKGRSVLVCDGVDLTPPEFNVRSRVHEYGGGSFYVSDSGVYFVNDEDRQLYFQNWVDQPVPITQSTELRFADFVFDKKRDRLITVVEQHFADKQPDNFLAAIDLKTGTVEPLVQGADFYAFPRLSPDGRRLCWLNWNQPDMPWDSTELWAAQIADSGNLNEPQLIAGGKTESIFQPAWSPDNVLYFVSDRSGWWNLYRDQAGSIEALHPAEAEFGYPLWVFGLSHYGFASDNQLIASYSQDGRWYLGSLDLNTCSWQTFELPYTVVDCVQVLRDRVLFLGTSPTAATAVVEFNLATESTTIHQRSAQTDLDLAYISVPEAISFPTTGGNISHAWYYPPQNKDYELPTAEQPPLIVKSHGGPTAAANPTLNWRIQYWTSRGFGYLDVNYGGSTGYGRAYRERLVGQWGCVDIDDCVNGAKFLAAQNRVDADRLTITGSSAGGYTTLAALTFSDAFKAGVSYYGVSDLEILAKETHKFEARYLDQLVGAYPEEKEIYLQRSPIHHASNIQCPVLFLQGEEDRVVPPNQAALMVKILKEQTIPVAYVAFAGEGHGFRQSTSIQRALESQLSFYAQLFGFTPADEIEKLAIANF